MSNMKAGLGTFKIFISYRRDTGIYIARTLRQSIERENPSLRIFIDSDELSGGNFNEALLKNIEETPNFIFVMSQGALDRCQNPDDWVRRELAQALRLGKRVIPVFEEGVKFPDRHELPEDIRAVVDHNGVEYSPHYHQEAIKKIINFLDLEHHETSIQREERIQKYFSRYMVPIKGGRFQMGSDNGLADEVPPHFVRISDFFMMRYQVTQLEYQELMGINPGNFKHPRKPVQNISWHDAIAFCNKWSLRDGLQEVYERNEDESVLIHYDRAGYRLPTEAEWEYASRAGTTSLYHWGDGLDDSDHYAWHDRNSDDCVHLVGTRKPNAWGLHDMTGNVWEWCNDWYDADYYSYADEFDPKGPERDFGEFKVMRGGAWAYDPYRLRAAARLKRDPALTDDVSGFRCVISAPPITLA